MADAESPAPVHQPLSDVRITRSNSLGPDPMAQFISQTSARRSSKSKIRSPVAMLAAIYPHFRTARPAFSSRLSTVTNALSALTSPVRRVAQYLRTWSATPTWSIRTFEVTYQQN